MTANEDGSAGSQPVGRAPSGRRAKAVGGRRRLVITGGLIAMFSLFGVVVWYAYRETQDLLRGAPKLVRAPEGPYRTRPEKPGGLPVLNESAPIVTVLEGREEPPGTERILPRQEPPARSGRELLPPPEESGPAAAQTGEAAKPGGEARTVARSGEPPAATAEPTTQPLLPGTAGVATSDAPAPMPDKLAADGLKEQTAPDLTAIAPAAGTTSAAASAAGSDEGAGTASAEPPPAAKEPAPPVTVAARKAPPPAAPAVPTEIFRIQLAAVRNEAAASRAWERFRQRYGDLLAGLEPVVQPARTSNGTLYRIQAGRFASREEARTRCARIRKAGGDCFVVGPVR